MAAWAKIASPMACYSSCQIWQLPNQLPNLATTLAAVKSAKSPKMKLFSFFPPSPLPFQLGFSRMHEVLYINIEQEWTKQISQIIIHQKMNKTDFSNNSSKIKQEWTKQISQIILNKNEQIRFLKYWTRINKSVFFLRFFKILNKNEQKYLDLMGAYNLKLISQEWTRMIH